MKNVDAALHVRGESQFIDDMAVPEGTLYAAVLSSPIAHGNIIKLSLAPAKNQQGIYGIFTAADIPGNNQIGNIVQDEPLLATKDVHYIGQPIAIVVGESIEIARLTTGKIEIEFEELPALFDAREAVMKGQLIIPPRTFSLGNIEETWQQCDVIVEGEADSGGQEHLYLETQGAFAYLTESGRLKVVSSTQSPTNVQRVIARILNWSMHQVEVDVLRLGGGFGGKEDQATPWATIAALAAFKLKKPVKLVLRRDEDMQMTGKRHPYSSDFKIGLTNEGQILAYEVTFYQNAGAASDLSPAILERTLFHSHVGWAKSFYCPPSSLKKCH